MRLQPSPLLDALGDVVRDVRADAGLSLREMERRTGVGRATISRLERRTPGPGVWRRVLDLIDGCAAIAGRQPTELWHDAIDRAWPDEKGES